MGAEPAYVAVAARREHRRVEVEEALRTQHAGALVHSFLPMELPMLPPLCHTAVTGPAQRRQKGQ